MLLWDVGTAHTSRETLAELRSGLPHVRVTFFVLGSTSHTQPCEGWPHTRSCQPLGLFTHHEPRRSRCFEAFTNGIEAHVPGLACTQRHSLETHLAVRRRVELSAYSGANTPCWRQPIHSIQTTPCSRNAACWRGRTRCGHGSRLIEEDGDVVDEDPDEAQLTDAHFFVDELEGSREDSAEPLPSPSAPTGPVQILTHLQALRIVCGKCVPG